MRSWDLLTEEQITSVLSGFDSFCKAVIRNEARNLTKAKARRAHHEFLCAEPLDLRGARDDYPSDSFEVETNAGKVIIQSMSVFDSLAALPERRRESLLLRYFLHWSDQKIALHFGVSTRTIRKWHHLSIDHMRRTLEKEYLHATAEYPNGFRCRSP